MSNEIVQRLESLVETLVTQLTHSTNSGAHSRNWNPISIGFTRLEDRSAFDPTVKAYVPVEVTRGRRGHSSMVSFPAAPGHGAAPIAQLLRTVSVLHRTLLSGGRLNKRDIYYSDPALFGSQATSDAMIAAVQSLLSVPRWRLGVYAAVRGLAVGAVEIAIVPETVSNLSTTTAFGPALPPPVSASQARAPTPTDPSAPPSVSFQGGREVPIDVSWWGADADELVASTAFDGKPAGLPVTRVRTSVEFVLVVEKETIFHRLLSLPPLPTSSRKRPKPGGGSERAGRQSFAERYNCLVVTGRGYPGVATRSLLAAVHRARPDIPFFALVDGDPHGVDIYTKYAFGSRGQAFDCPFGLPSLVHIGLRVSDLDVVLPSLAAKAARRASGKPPPLALPLTPLAATPSLPQLLASPYTPRPAAVSSATVTDTSDDDDDDTRCAPSDCDSIAAAPSTAPLSCHQSPATDASWGSQHGVFQSQSQSLCPSTPSTPTAAGPPSPMPFSLHTHAHSYSQPQAAAVATPEPAKRRGILWPRQPAASSHAPSTSTAPVTAAHMQMHRTPSAAAAAAERTAARALRPLSSRDYAKLDSLLAAPFFSESARAGNAGARAAHAELVAMRDMGSKAELDVLAVDDDGVLERYIVDTVRKHYPAVKARGGARAASTT